MSVNLIDLLNSVYNSITGRLKVEALGDGGSGGSVGGGNNTYSTEQGDFSVSFNGVNSVTLSTDVLGGSQITEANFLNGILSIYDTSLGEAKDITLDKFTWDSATKVLDFTGATGVFDIASDDKFSLTLIGVDKNRDASLNAERTNVLNQPQDNYTDPIAIRRTDVAIATHQEVISMEGFQNIDIQITGADDGTSVISLTIWETLDPLAVESSDAYWRDITLDVTGSATLSGDIDSYLKILGKMPRQYKIKYVVTTETYDTLDIVYRKY